MEKPKLLNEDCLKSFISIKDNSIDLILTDPPFGISYQSNRQRVDRRKSVNGEGSINVRDHYFEEIADDKLVNVNWLKEAYRVLKEGSALYFFCHWSKWHELYPVCADLGFRMKNMIVLNKSNHGAGDLKGSYAPKHELLLFATKGRHELRFPEGRADDIWNVPVKFSGSRRFHPNEKAISWLTPAIDNSSDSGDTVLDPFMGSGSTGIAAASKGRSFIGIEKDKEYFDIAVSRVTEVFEKHDNKIL